MYIYVYTCTASIHGEGSFRDILTKPKPLNEPTLKTDVVHKRSWCAMTHSYV